MEAYEAGGHAYHATMPTDALRGFRDAMKETEAEGFARVQAAQEELGEKVRSLFAARGFASVAAEGFVAPGVVACYTDAPAIKSGATLAAAGLQTPAAVPPLCAPPDPFPPSRDRLFGLAPIVPVHRTDHNPARPLHEVAGPAPRPQ